MSKFRKKSGKGLQAINTSSLPDIVFMLLFFFMVATTMRETEVQVKVKVPEATEVKKLEKKSIIRSPIRTVTSSRTVRTLGCRSP